MLFTKTKPQPHKAKVLQALKKAGHYGQWTHELVKPGVGGHRLSSYIQQLRKEGHTIRVVSITRNEFKYFLEDE